MFFYDAFSASRRNFENIYAARLVMTNKQHFISNSKTGLAKKLNCPPERTETGVDYYISRAFLVSCAFRPLVLRNQVSDTRDSDLTHGTKVMARNV